MVAVKHLTEIQVQTRRITACALAGTLVLIWTSLILLSGDTASQPVRLLGRSYRPPQGMKILYIITSSREYNNGERETLEGQDRLMEITIPALLDGLTTMVSYYHVDVYLVLGYELSTERQNKIQDLLPTGVGLQVWSQAIPISYEYFSAKERRKFLSQANRILARQHRFVVKDKLQHYDFFLAFEDDMLIKKAHIDYYLQFRNEIEILKQDAPRSELSESSSQYDRSTKFWGNLTWEQLDRTFPGFLRVEVLTDPARPSQVDLGPIPVNGQVRPDPRICCHGQYVGLRGKLAPQYPHSSQLVIWETAIEGLSVRRMPTHSMLDWVALLNIKASPNVVSGYWTGTDGVLLPEFSRKPPTNDNQYIGQPAGWMASAKEILDFQSRICKGQSFLPPFNPPHMRDDGMGWTTDSVEFWSGGLQLWGQMCEIQRMVSLDPQLFSNHLIYHTANNKQKEIERERLVKVQTLLGQLYTVQQRAQDDMKRQTGPASLWERLFSTDQRLAVA